MISLEKWLILTPLQKLPNNVGDLGKKIVANGFEWLPKVQKIAQSGLTVCRSSSSGLRPIDWDINGQGWKKEGQKIRTKNTKQQQQLK